MDTLTRQWLILRMIPRNKRIATPEILARLGSEYNIDTTIRTVQRDMQDLPLLSPWYATKTALPAGVGVRMPYPSKSPAWTHWQHSRSGWYGFR